MKDQKKKSFSETANYVKHRALATKIFYSGNFEKLRQQAIRNGALPYRILNYQRVVAPEKTPIPLANGGYIHPDNFEKQLRYISSECNVITLNLLTELITENKRIPDRTVVVTFDNGHMDNYLYAFPLLLKYQVPATFFISTGYIQNNMFLYNDRLILKLINIKTAGKGFPIIEHLSENIQKEINKITPTGEITEELVNYLNQAMTLASAEDRFIMMDALANLDEEIPKLLEFEDFMRWDDLRHMQSVGFQFGTMGHFAIANPEINKDLYISDLGNSADLLKKHEIKVSDVVCLPRLAPSEAVLQALGELNCNYAMTNLFYPEPRFQTKLPMLLSRIPISQANAGSIEFFGCELWGIDTE